LLLVDFVAFGIFPSQHLESNLPSTNEVITHKSNIIEILCPLRIDPAIQNTEQEVAEFCAEKAPDKDEEKVAGKGLKSNTYG
jgi:hypothetical protein